VTELSTVIRLFEDSAERETSLPLKTHLKILCKGYAAAARGWRLLAIGEGDEAEIREALRQATIPLMGNQKRRQGPGNKPLAAVDEKVLRRYYERDQLDLTLRHFVEAAFDEGLYRGWKAGSVDVHVNRLQRYEDRRRA
jgi:hypothetical protein